MRPSSAMRARMAAPAECPAASTGVMFNARSRSSTDRAMPGNDNRADAGASVKP